MNYRTISSYENNTLCPGVDIIIKYCDFFAVRPDDLFGYREASSGHRRLIITDDNEARIIESYRNAPDWVQEAIDIVALKAYDHHRAVRRNRPHVPVGIAENSPAYDTEEEKEAVGAFLSWWCTPEVQQAWIESCGYPVTMASAASEEYRTANEWYAVYENIAAYGIGLAVPGHEADSISIRNTVAEYIVECIEKTDADVQSIMDACKAELDAEFSS